MKVTVSIPELIFSDAERVAARLGVSRSALYTRAVADFVERPDPDDIIGRLNAMVDEFGQPTVEDEAWLRAGARAVLGR